MVNSRSLRVEIPRDASPEELADVCAALLGEPDVARLLPPGTLTGTLESVNCGSYLPHDAFLQGSQPQGGGNQGGANDEAWWGKIGGVAGVLAKALKIGGPAHAGLSASEVENRQSAARAALPALQRAFVDDLSANFAAWDAAIDLAHEAATGVGAVQLSFDGALELQGRVWRVVERDARAVIRDAYRQAWQTGREAAGNFAPMGTDEQKQLERMYRAQQNYWLNLLKDRSNGTGQMDFGQRTNMYGNALRAAFWAGQVLADLSGDVFWKWRLSDRENCGDCLKLARSGRFGSGVYSARELARMGVFPGSGDTQCLTQCGCELERTARPQRAPRGRTLKSIELVGPRANSFEGNGRTEREAHARGVERGSWNHKGKR